MTYCIVPADLAAKLHESLRRHFRDDPSIEVVVERRRRERRGDVDRRASDSPPPARDRRLIPGSAGRRIGEQRASLVPVEPPALPRRLQRHAERLLFVERLEPSDRHGEDLDTARLVTRFQAGDRDAFATLYMRYFERVFAYLRIAFNDHHEAEDGAQQIFVRVLEALPAYERRGRPFRSWLFRIVRNFTLDELRKRSHADVWDPRAIDSRREELGAEELELAQLDWITDRDLLLFVERLPLPQRQILLLRFMLDLSTADIARVLDRTQDDVRLLQSRALRFLRGRLIAIGRAPERRGRPAPAFRRFRQVPVLRSRRFALYR